MTELSNKIVDLQNNAYIYVATTTNKNILICRGDWKEDDKWLFQHYTVIDLWWWDDEKYFLVKGVNK